jgi:4-oxalocrotonate tautomerase
MRRTPRLLQFSFCIGEIQFLNWFARNRRRKLRATLRADPKASDEEKSMPLVDIELIEGVFDQEQKQEMIRRVTDAMVAVEGEAMRGVTWVRVHEVASGEWAIGGKPLTAADVKALRQK